MLEIYKKRMIYIMIVLLVCFAANSLLEERKQKIIDVNATPITNKVIILDAGHGLPDQGATGYFNTTEQYINLTITMKLQKLIEQSGAKVLLTRSDENGIYSIDSISIRNKKVSDIKNRVKIGNESSADVLISIHLNKFPPSEIYKGWQTFYQKNNTNSKELSEKIQSNINKNIEVSNNRVPHSISNVYLMDKVQIPSIIIECGFLSNKEETKLLKTDEYQNKLAWGIFIGLQEYFEGQGVKTNE